MARPLPPPCASSTLHLSGRVLLLPPASQCRPLEAIGMAALEPPRGDCGLPPPPPRFSGELTPRTVSFLGRSTHWEWGTADQRSSRFHPDPIGREPARPADWPRSLNGEKAYGEPSCSPTRGYSLLLKAGSTLKMSVFCYNSQKRSTSLRIFILSLEGRLQVSRLFSISG